MFGFWRILCTVTQSCLILCDPMDCSLPDSSGPWVILARILEWVAISSCRGSSWPRDRICGSCIGRQILYHWAAWEALGAVYNILNNNTVSQLPLLVPVFNEDCLNLLMKHNMSGQVEGTHCHFCDSKQLEHHDKVLLPSSRETAAGRLEGTSWEAALPSMPQFHKACTPSMAYMLGALLRVL